MKTRSTALVSALASTFVLAGAAFAQTKTFNIVTGDLAYRNLATVESVADFETFTGKTTSISGSIDFDPKKRMGKGSITIKAADVDTGIPLRNDHMRDAQWLNTAKFPNITFTTTSVKAAANDSYTVRGNFTMKGVTKAVTATVRLRFRAKGEATAKAGFDGDVVQITTSFNVNLSDYGIKIPQQAVGKVSNTVKISLSAYAVAK